MQTSLSPSVCRAFSGCQIKKAVDELNLAKKVVLWFAKTRSCGFSNESPIPKSSVELENEGGVAEVNQHRMVLEVKPATKDLKTTVLWPSRFVVLPFKLLVKGFPEPLAGPVAAPAAADPVRNG